MNYRVYAIINGETQFYGFTETFEAAQGLLEQMARFYGCQGFIEENIYGF